MYKLLIFTVVMLALASICNGQGRTSFGATRSQDTSYTKGRVKFEAYTDADSNVLVVKPNGDIIKMPFSTFVDIYTAGFGLNLSGNQFSVDTSVIATLFDVSLKVNYTDTAAMLAPYLRSADTASLSNRIDQRVKYTDTAAMLAPYARKVYVDSATGTVWKLGGNNVAGLTNFGTTTNFAIPFITNGTEKMRLDTDGDLGIGNTNPQYAIDVLRNSNGVERVVFSNANAGPLTQAWISAGSSNTTSANLIGQTSPARGALFSSGGPLWLGTNLELASGGTQPIIFSTGGVGVGQEKMRLDAEGDLGVGTTNPSFAVEVQRNVNGIERILMNNANVGASAQTWIQAGNGTVAAMLVAHSAFSGGKAGLYSTGCPLWLGTNIEVPSGGTQPIIFSTGGTGSLEKMRLDSDGDLGIGNNNPIARLHINKNATGFDQYALRIDGTPPANTFAYGIYQSNPWTNIGGTPNGTSNVFGGRNTFGGNGIGSLGTRYDYKFVYQGVNMMVGADQGAGGGNAFESNTTTPNTNKIWMLRAPQYPDQSGQRGIMAYSSDAAIPDGVLYVGGELGYTGTTVDEIWFGVNDLRAMRLRANGHFSLGTPTSGNIADNGHMLEVRDGSVKFAPTATTSSTWSGTLGSLSIVSDPTLFQGERTLNINAAGKTSGLALGVGGGGQVSDNIAFVGYRTTEAGISHGFYFDGASGIKSIAANNVQRFGILNGGSNPAHIYGAGSGTFAGSTFTFVSNAINGGAPHQPTTGTWNFMTFQDDALGVQAFRPTSGNAQMNTLNIITTINQTGGASGVTRGVNVAPILTAAADYRAFSATLTGNHYGFHLTAARNFTTGTIEAVGFMETIVNTSGALAPTPNRHYFFSGAAAVWTLPAVAGNTNAKIMVKNVGTGAITVNSNAGGNDIFTGAAVNTMTVNVGDFVMFVNNGTYWGVE